MSNWKEDRIKLIEDLKKKYEVETLEIPIFSLNEFDYVGETFQNKNLKAISRFKEFSFNISNYDHLSGCFDGNKMHCFFRTKIPLEDTLYFEALLKKYNILFEKETRKKNSYYACDIGRLDMKNVKNIKEYSNSKDSIGNIFYNLSKKLSERLL